MEDILIKKQMNNKLAIVDFLGDICFSEGEVDSSHAIEIAEKINSFLGNADYRIANLESPIVQNKDNKPIDKSGPNLKFEKRYIPFLEKLHVDGYALANNHIGDYGISGIEDTINTLRQLKKEYVGIVKEYGELFEPLRKEIQGIKISILSICENEFGVARNGRTGSAGYDRSIVKQTIQEERNSADYVVIVFHGGNEHNPFPSPGQQLRYRELIEFGAGAVIGMHTHCPQGYEIYHNAPIIYSVGNFFFPQKQETPFATWKVGYVARLVFKKGEKINIEIIPYKFDIYGKDFFAIDKKCFFNYINQISVVIQEERKLNCLYKAWAVISGKNYFEQMCKCVNELNDRKKMAAVKNLFSCEAHVELLKTYLDILYENEIEKYNEYKEKIKHYMKFSGEKNWDKKVNENNFYEADTVIWGIGKKAEILYKKLQLKGKKIVFTDKNCLKQGLLFCEKQVISPEDVVSNYRKAEIYICTSEKSALEIQEFLEKNNIDWKKNEK